MYDGLVKDIMKNYAFGFLVVTLHDYFCNQLHIAKDEYVHQLG
jgi:hypothetical protein